MNIITHMAAAIALFLLFAGLIGLETDYQTFLICALFAALPDIDHPMGFLGRLVFPLSNYIYNHYGHRTITHSLWALFTVSGFGFILWLPGIVSASVFVAMFSGYLGHIISDGMTRSGVPLLYPNVKPFWFLPNSFLITTGSWQELVLCLCLTTIVAVLTGISNIGLRELLHIITPSYRGAFLDWCNHCDIEGQLCLVSVHVCDKIGCGEFNGVALGIVSGSLVLYDPNMSKYYIISEPMASVARTNPIMKISINKKDFQFVNKPVQYLSGELRKYDQEYSTISGNVEFDKNDMLCDNCNGFFIDEKVLGIQNNVITFNHLRIKDFNKLRLQGFIQSAHIEITERG